MPVINLWPLSSKSTLLCNDGCGPLPADAMLDFVNRGHQRDIVRHGRRKGLSFGLGCAVLLIPKVWQLEGMWETHW